MNFQVDKGMSGMAPGTPAPFLAVSTLTFKTLEGFQESFAKHGHDLMADSANFTNIEMQAQISEVLL